MLFDLLYRERYLYSVIYKSIQSTPVQLIMFTIKVVPWLPDVPRYSHLGLTAALQLRRLQPHLPALLRVSFSFLLLLVSHPSPSTSSSFFAQVELCLSHLQVPLDSLLFVYSQASCRSPTLHHSLSLINSSHDCPCFSSSFPLLFSSLLFSYWKKDRRKKKSYLYQDYFLILIDRRAILTLETLRGIGATFSASLLLLSISLSFSQL